MLLLPLLALGQTNSFNILDSQAASINSGTINGATIGATTPASGAFTTLTSSGLNAHSNAVAVGSTPVTTTSVLVNRDFTGDTNIIGVGVRPTVQADNTNTARLFYTAPNTVASTFTLSSLQHFRADQGTIGTNSVVSNQFGFYAHSSLTGATINYGFYSDISAAASRWNYFANGTANNAFSGNTRIGSTTAPTVALDVTGAIAGSGALTLPGLAIVNTAVTGTLCWTTTTGNITVDTTGACLSSTIKVKENVYPLDIGLNQVLAMRPVSYDLKKEFNPDHQGRQVGLIAEEMALIDLRLTMKDDGGGVRGVRYQQLTAVLVKAIQEQQAEIRNTRIALAIVFFLALLISFKTKERKP